MDPAKSNPVIFLFMLMSIKFLHCQVNINGKNIKFKYSDKVYGGPLDEPLPENDDDFYIPLEAALERTFARTNAAIVLAEGKWFAVRRSTKTGIIVFNPHAVSLENRECENVNDGVSRAFYCCSNREVVLTLMAGLKGNSYLSLYGVEPEVHH